MDVPMTDRTVRLRGRYLQTPVARRIYIPHNYGNHPMTVHWLEGYLAAQKTAETMLMRRSMAQAAEFEHSAVIITDEELIVGQNDFRAWFEDNAHFRSLADMYRMAPDINADGRSDHTCLDYETLLRIGVNGLIARIEEQKASLAFTKESMEEDIAKEEFYDASLIELRALLSFAARYEAELRRMANEETDEKRRGELFAMADNMAHVPAEPASTFWEALQSIHFYTFCLRGLYSAGRVDQYLLPYYEADIRAGRLTEEFAQELIDNFCLLYSTYIYAITAVGMMVGGTDREGKPVENALTWAFLRAVDHIRMPDPNLGLCVTEQTSPALLRYAFDMIGRGVSFPSFWNDADVVKGMIRNGFSEEDAHLYINSTCVELTSAGKSCMWTTAPYHNLAALFLEVFNGEDYPDYETLEAAYFARVKRAFAEENHRLNRIMLERSRNPSEPMLQSCLISDCIGRGKPVGRGGALYNATLPNVLGYANTVDALCAVKELVYRKKSVSMEDYRRAVAENFEGCEQFRSELLQKMPHYGNNDPEADSVAAALAECLEEACCGQYTLRGDPVIPGNFSYNYHVLYGSRTGATPDGRKSGEPLSDSAGPAQGRDVHSPTAALLSGTCWEQNRFLGGVAQNIRLSRKYFEDERMDVPIALLKAFFARGGCELQFNCVDRKTLEDAELHPELYENLLVRVGGYSDFFVKLGAKQQKEIIERTDYQ